MGQLVNEDIEVKIAKLIQLGYRPTQISKDLDIPLSIAKMRCNQHRSAEKKWNTWLMVLFLYALCIGIWVYLKSAN